MIYPSKAIIKAEKDITKWLINERFDFDAGVKSDGTFQIRVVFPDWTYVRFNFETPSRVYVRDSGWCEYSSVKHLKDKLLKYKENIPSKW